MTEPRLVPLPPSDSADAERWRSEILQRMRMASEEKLAASEEKRLYAESLLTGRTK